jgi:hypothetical protein
MAKEIRDFSAIEEEFMARVRRIVWCTVATVDERGRPRTRILHPIWQGPLGWIGTGRHSLKERHLARTPYVSLTYWDPTHQQVYVECRAAWDDRPEEKRRVWDLYKATPPPLGYDLSIIPGWTSPDAPAFGLLRLEPYRIELSGIDLASGAMAEPVIWRPTP